MASLKVRVGIAGTGFIGGVHARSARLAGARIVGVAASSAENATAAANPSTPASGASAEELVRDPEVDVVHICTPNHLHFPLAKAALAAGKHVVCEKPLALDAAGAQRLGSRPPSRAGRCRPVRLPLLPHGARGAGADRAGETGRCTSCTAPTSRTGCVAPRTTTGGWTKAWVGRAGVRGHRSHWCDLVEFVTVQRVVRISARTLTTVSNESATRGGRPSPALMAPASCGR